MRKWHFPQIQHILNKPFMNETKAAMPSRFNWQLRLETPASVLPELQIPRGDWAWRNSTASPQHPRKEAHCPSMNHSTVTLDANLSLVISSVQILFRHRHPVFYKIRLNALTPFCCLRAAESWMTGKKKGRLVISLPHAYTPRFVFGI